MTTFELTPAQKEIKEWMHQDFLNQLDLMGYDSYQEFLDAMAYDEMMEAARVGDELESPEF